MGGYDNGNNRDDERNNRDDNRPFRDPPICFGGVWWGALKRGDIAQSGAMPSLKM